MQNGTIDAPKRLSHIRLYVGNIWIDARSTNILIPIGLVDVSALLGESGYMLAVRFYNAFIAA